MLFGACIIMACILDMCSCASFGVYWYNGGLLNNLTEDQLPKNLSTDKEIDLLDFANVIEPLVYNEIRHSPTVAFTVLEYLAPELPIKRGSRGYFNGTVWQREDPFQKPLKLRELDDQKLEELKELERIWEERLARKPTLREVAYKWYIYIHEKIIDTTKYVAKLSTSHRAGRSRALIYFLSPGGKILDMSDPNACVSWLAQVKVYESQAPVLKETIQKALDAKWKGFMEKDLDNGCISYYGVFYYKEIHIMHAKSASTYEWSELEELY